MKVAATKNVPVDKPKEFAKAMLDTNTFTVTIATITTSSDLATLIRHLNGKSRPFAVAVLEGK